MSKNIDNRNAIVTGISVSSTDSVPEGVTNLYYTASRVNSLIGTDPNYKNAESIFLSPISGPALFGGQMLIYDGTVWQVTSNMILNNSDLTVSAGSYAFPNAIYGRLGPRSIVKLAGNIKIAEIDVAVVSASGYIELFITAEDTITNDMYQNCDKFFYKNNAGTTSATVVSGFHSSEFSLVPVASKLEVYLNTVNDANVTITMTFQTVQGAAPSIIAL
jgi:hypothetical protein